MIWLEFYGYLGSALIAISLMMGDIRKLRWINLVGAGAFASYGLLIGSWPVAVLNGFIVLIDVVHLWRIYRRPAPLAKAEFSISDDYVQKILSRDMPQVLNLDTGQQIRVTFRGPQPVGFDLVEPHKENNIDTRLAA